MLVAKENASPRIVAEQNGNLNGSTPDIVK